MAGAGRSESLRVTNRDKRVKWQWKAPLAGLGVKGRGGWIAKLPETGGRGEESLPPNPSDLPRPAGLRAQGRREQSPADGHGVNGLGASPMGGF